MRHMSKGESRTLEARRSASATRDTDVEVGRYQHGLRGGIAALTEGA
jgi:hypothetical protein